MRDTPPVLTERSPYPMPTPNPALNSGRPKAALLGTLRAARSGGWVASR